MKVSSETFCTLWPLDLGDSSKRSKSLRPTNLLWKMKPTSNISTPASPRSPRLWRRCRSKSPWRSAVTSGCDFRVWRSDVTNGFNVLTVFSPSWHWVSRAQWSLLKKLLENGTKWSLKCTFWPAMSIWVVALVKKSRDGQVELNPARFRLFVWDSSSIRLYGIFAH